MEKIQMTSECIKDEFDSCIAQQLPYANLVSREQLVHNYYKNYWPYTAQDNISDPTASWSSNANDSIAYIGSYDMNPYDQFGFSFQPAYNFGYTGTGDYTTWTGIAAPQLNSIGRKTVYEEYYRDNRYSTTNTHPLGNNTNRLHDRTILNDGLKNVENSINNLKISQHNNNENLNSKENDKDNINLSISNKNALSFNNSSSNNSNFISNRLSNKTQVGREKSVTLCTNTTTNNNNNNNNNNNEIDNDDGSTTYTDSENKNSNNKNDEIKHSYLNQLKLKNQYNPKEFDLVPKGARFFVIKSYSEDDVHRSIKYNIWCSTEHGNRRLDQAFREREGKGPVYLFFSVNGSGHFCGMAEMMSCVDYDSKSDIWSQDKWKGKFEVKWVYVKDVPNSQLRNIRLENNENKPVTNSRDTQEIPFEKGKQVLKVFHQFNNKTSIFDDFEHYEKRQDESFKK